MARRTTRTATTSPRRVLGYIRVSTGLQADSGLGLAAQRAQIEGYAALYGLVLVDVVVDAGESASTLRRPGLTAALDRLAAGDVGGLLIAKLDRLTRTVADLSYLVDLCHRQGWALLSVADQLDTDSAAGRMVMSILAVVSQWEREAIGERTAAALAIKAARGERVGAVPYGHRLADDGIHLVADPAEQKVLHLARELRSAGMSLRAVAAELDRLGYRARTGRVFAATQISRMVA